MSSIIINGIQYSDCPEIDVPKVGGGTAKFYDTSDANITSASLLQGTTGYGASGSVSGSIPVNGSTSGTIGTKTGSVSIPTGYTTGGTVTLTNVSDCIAQNILSGKSILGVSGSLQMPTISQDATSRILSIS